MRPVGLRGMLLPLIFTTLWACGDDNGATDVEPVTSIEVDPTTMDLVVGGSATITATPRGASGDPLTGRNVTFTSNDESIATVTQAGVVTGEGEGETTIIVSSEGVSAQVDVNVEPAPVASIEVSPDPLEMVVGEMATLTVILEDAQGNELTDRNVEFLSNNEDIVTVDGDGVVTAHQEGSTTITVSAEDESTDVTVEVSPVPVATIEVDPSELDLVVGEEQALTVTLRDAEDNVLEDREVTFESDDEDVATVSDEGVVRGVGVGPATITVSSEGQEAQVDVDVTAPPFQPTEDTEIDGDRQWASIDIPAGVTVTVTAGSVLHSLGTTNVEGMVMADCVEVQIISDGAVTVEGTIDNRCTSDPDADGDQLRIVGTGAMTFTGSVVTSSGDLTITNDSTLSLGDFEAAQTFGIPVRGLGAAQGAPCSYSGMSSPNRPQPPTPETTGKSGANGTDARTKRYLCDGDMDFDGGEYDGYDAGDGEEGDAADTDDSQGPAEGGDGGDAGQVRILATGDIDFTGGVRINLGDGGKGGNATRNAPPNRAAEAIGGAGGQSGTMIARAGGAIRIPEMGGLVIDIGRPGDGGDAFAQGGKGDDSTPTEAAKSGGNATATGGAGGDTPDADFEASGAVMGVNNITLTGGPAGMGGKATAVGGQGGHGVVEENKPGAKGGDQTATGGKGGEAPAGNFTGQPFVNAGDGGDAEGSGGVGGNGFNGCSVVPPVEGGDGGDGGNGNLTGGDGGTEGLASGTGGEAVIQMHTGDGGNGNDGVGPGTGGDGGTQGASDGASPAPGAVDDMDPNYETGANGRLCIAVEGDPIVAEHIVGESPCPQLIGTLTITNPYDEPISVSISPLSSAIETDPAGGIGIPAGGTVEVAVYFNCMTTSSFSTIIQIMGGTADGFQIVPVEVPVTMDIIFSF